MVPVGVLAAATEAGSVVKHFRTEGAISPGKAIEWRPQGKTQDYEHRRLIAKGALVEMRRGRYYLNEEKLAAGGALHGAMVSVGVALLALMVGLLLVL